MPDFTSSTSGPIAEHAPRPRLTGGVILVLFFTLAYLAAAFFLSVRLANQEFILYIGVVAFLALLIGLLHWRVRLSLGVLWALSLWGLLHMLGGLLPIPAAWPNNADPGHTPVLYNWWILPILKYDHLTHAFGFGVTTWVCWQGLRAAVAGLRGGPASRVLPTAGLLILCAAAGVGFGAMNEVVEFAATLALPQTNVGGYVNTGWDLVSNTAGALAAVTLIYSFGRHSAAVALPPGTGDIA